MQALVFNCITSLMWQYDCELCPTLTAYCLLVVFMKACCFWGLPFKNRVNFEWIGLITFISHSDQEMGRLTPIRVHVSSQVNGSSSSSFS